MYLLWLRVAAILYAAAAVAVFPAVLYGIVRWRKTCVHLAGWPSSSTSSHALKCLSRPIAGCPWACARSSRCWVLPCRPVFSCLVALRRYLPWHLRLADHFFRGFCARLGAERYIFPSEGVRISWLIAHIAALLAAYVALGFSLLASVLYLVQERRLKSKLKPGEDSLVASSGLAAAAGYAGAHCPRHA